MNDFPSKKTVTLLRKRFLAGCRVELVSMDDPYSQLAPGERGTVAMVDDIGTIFVDWDSGSRLGVVYGVDQLKLL